LLQFPSVNPQGERIPGADGGISTRSVTPLAALSAGQGGHVIRCEVDDATQAFLDKQDVRPGAPLTVVATAEDSVLVQVGDGHISLARTLAERAQVETEGKMAKRR